MIEMFAGVAVCGVSVFYVSTVVNVIAGQRESDRLEFYGLIGDLRADLDALLDHLGLEIAAGWPEEEPAPVELEAADDTPTGPIQIVEPAPETTPMTRAWDQAAAELVAAERPPASEWVEAELEKVRARSVERPKRNRHKAKEDAA